MTRCRRLATALFVLTVFAGPAIAQQRGPYFGVGVGDADFQVDLASFDDGSLAAGDVDRAESALRVFGGYRMGPAWAIEGGWIDFNADPDDRPTFSGVSDGSGPEFPAGAVSREIEPQGVYAALLFYAYSGGRLTVFLEGGYLAWRADVTTIDAVGQVDEQTDGTDLMYGAGARLRLVKWLWLRGDWGRFKQVAGDDIELTTLGLSIELGRR